MADELVTMAHGSGGSRMLDLLREMVFPLLDDPRLEEAEDAAALDLPEGKLAFTTDSFVVKPLFFPGGDIGKLAVCGTVNDLSMRGARPLYLTMGLIIEEGFPLHSLRRVLASAGEWARRAGVGIVAGDTKVVERGMADGLYVNTSGVGYIPAGKEVSIRGARPGDLILVNGYVGDHEVAVLGCREGLPLEISVQSDCSPLNDLVKVMQEAGRIHALRDPTRGGLAAVLKEMAEASGVDVEIEEEKIPLRREVRAVCELLGLDPLYLANEGKLVAAVPEEDAHRLLEAMRSHPLGGDTGVIGRVTGKGKGMVSLVTALGSRRLVRMPSGEQFPRIC